MSVAIVLWVAATTLGLLTIATAVALVDNRLRYGRWLPRRPGNDQPGLGPKSAADRDAFYGGGGGAP